MSDINNYEINKFYQGVTQYYNKIAQEANKTIINWIFALNTGGLILLIPFMFKFYNCQLVVSIFAAVFYFFGIISIYSSITNERKKYNKLADNAEKKYSEYQNNIITGKEYLSIIRNISTDNKALLLEYASIIFWLLGNY